MSVLREGMVARYCLGEQKRNRTLTNVYGKVGVLGKGKAGQIWAKVARCRLAIV